LIFFANFPPVPGIICRWIDGNWQLRELVFDALNDPCVNQEKTNKEIEISKQV
jgi:hypothetical protein